MNRLVCLVALVLLCGCKGITIQVPDPGYAGPEPTATPTHQPPPGPYAHMQQRQSFSPKTSVQLKESCYVGNFVLGRSQIKVTGAGVGKTVIDGNLVLQTQCVVSNLTVTGDVIFEGHQAKLENVDFFGQVIDKGVQNKY